MSQKIDYYKALGLTKTATDEEIKKAHKSIIMRNHPDRQLNKTEAEKAAAQEAYANAQEAFSVLSTKRAIYDKHGHAGVQAVKNSNTSTTSTPAPQQPQVRRVPQGSALDFFADLSGEESVKKEAPAAEAPAAPQQDKPAADAPRRPGAEARKARLAGQQSSSSASKLVAVTSTFNNAVLYADEAANLLRDIGNDDVPQEAITRLRRSVDALSAQIKSKGF